MSHDENVRRAWNYPLYQAILQRRSRRFPLGAERSGDLTPFKSRHAPVPLDEVEEALLVMAGTGLTGLTLSDFRSGDSPVHFSGRTFASGDASHATELFFTNDRGTFIVKLRDAVAERVTEYEGADDWERLVEVFRKHTVKILDHRLDIPMTENVTFYANQWNANKPGTTVFMPISDVTWGYLHFLFAWLKPPHSYYFYDDMNGNAEPLKKYADAGKLDRSRAVPLSGLEMRFFRTVSGFEPAFMIQNMFLASQALGIGGWLFSASNPTVVFGGTPLSRGLGFRFAKPEKPGPVKLPDFVPARPFPVGLDGVFQAQCPPYFPDMAAAVQAAHDYKWGPNGVYVKQRGAKKNFDSGEIKRAPDWVTDAAKELCTYIWETYGRFPASIDPIQMSIWFQAHHLETEYYDQHFEPGAYHQEIAEHMGRWHR